MINNTHNNDYRFVTHPKTGETNSKKGWAVKLGISPATMTRRIQHVRAGQMRLTEALEKPGRSYNTAKGATSKKGKSPETRTLLPGEFHWPAPEASVGERDV